MWGSWSESDGEKNRRSSEEVEDVKASPPASVDVSLTPEMRQRKAIQKINKVASKVRSRRTTSVFYSAKKKKKKKKSKNATGRKRSSSFQVVNAATGMKLNYVEDADKRGWGLNKVRIRIMEATISNGAVFLEDEEDERCCFVEFELAEKWYNRTLPDGTTVLWGQKGKICRSETVAYGCDLNFERPKSGFTNQFDFDVRIPETEIVLTLCEMRGTVIKVIGRTKIGVMDLVQRDLDQVLPNDLRWKNDSAAEIFELYDPKYDDRTVGTLTMKIAYTEQWSALCLNMEPHFLPFEKNHDTAVTAEIKRFQNNITRIGIAYGGIRRFMKTLEDLFGWWDIGKSLLVVVVGLYIIWIVPESYTAAIFPWLLVAHILYQRKLRRKTAGTHEYDKNLLKFDVANHADAKVRVSVIAAHGLPLTDNLVLQSGKVLRHASMGVVPEDPDDELSALWCKALQQTAELERRSADLLADTKTIIEEYGRKDYFYLKSKLIEKYGEEMYNSCKSRVQALLIHEDTASGKVGQWIKVRESSKYRSIFANKPTSKRVWCVVKDSQLGWGDAMNDDIRKQEFRCNLVDMEITQKSKGDHTLYMIESKSSARPPPFCHWICFSSDKKGKDFYLKVKDATIEAEQAARQTEYLNKRTIKKIESAILTGEYYKLGTRRWKKRKMTLSDTALVYESVSWFSQKVKVVPTDRIERVEFVDPATLPSMGLTFSETFGQSLKSVLWFVRTDAGKSETTSSTKLVFFFETDDVAKKWKDRMESILHDVRSVAASVAGDDEGEGAASKNDKGDRDESAVAAQVFNKKLYDSELATQLIDECSQGRIGFVEDKGSEYVKIICAAVFCWYMEVTFVRHISRKFFYPSANPTASVVRYGDGGTFSGAEFVTHMKSLNSQIRDDQVSRLQEFLMKNKLLIRIAGHMSILHPESYWQFNTKGNRLLGKNFIRTKFVEDLDHKLCSPDVFVTVHLEENSRDIGSSAVTSKTKLIGRTNTEYMNTSPEFGTNLNKPLASGIVDAFLAFARKSRNKLFRVHRDLEMIKWDANLGGSGVRQWYWAFEFTTPRPTLASKARIAARDSSKRLSRRSMSLVGGKFRKTLEHVRSTGSELAMKWNSDDDTDEEDNVDVAIRERIVRSDASDACMLPLLDFNVHDDSFSPQRPSRGAPLTTSPVHMGLYPPRVEEAVAAESIRARAASPLPPEPLRRKEHGGLLPWTQCTDHLVFKIWDEDFSVQEGFGDDKIGICRVPLVDFIPQMNKEGGRQPDIWKWIPIEMSDAHVERKKKLGCGTGSDGGAWLLVRVQVLLRQGEKEVDFEDSKSGFLYMYNRTIAVIKNINDFLENAVITYEKLKNLFNWTHPRKTQAALIIIVILSIVTMQIPLKVLVMGLFIFPFTGIFRPPGGLMWMSEHVISSIPDDISRRKILERAPPLPVSAIPRADHLPGVVCSGYVRHATTRSRDPFPGSELWKRRFVALTPDSWIFLWESREDGRRTLAEAITKTQESMGVRKQTSYTAFLAPVVERPRDRRSSSISPLALFEDSPVLHAKAWRVMATCATDEKKNSELDAMISGCFQVRGRGIWENRRGKWHLISILDEKSDTKHWLAFKQPEDAERWSKGLKLFRS